MRRILLDQGLSPATAVLLRSDGWDALHVIEAGLDRADDLEILNFARRDKRVCITLDHHFHAHLALAQMAGPSVIFVRSEGLNSFNQAMMLRRVWEVCKALSQPAPLCPSISGRFASESCPCASLPNEGGRLAPTSTPHNPARSPSTPPPSPARPPAPNQTAH